jgi:hypothetical protein
LHSLYGNALPLFPLLCGPFSITNIYYQCCRDYHHKDFKLSVKSIHQNP